MLTNQYNNIIAGGNFNQLISSGVVHPTGILIVPYVSSQASFSFGDFAWKSPFDTVPADAHPLSLTNLQVTVGGQNVLQSVLNYNYESFLEQLIYNEQLTSADFGVTTGLFDAAYYGSDHCMNYLINRGADIHHKNKKGETIYDVLDVGLKAAIERFPNAVEIVENRFEDCIHLVKKAEARKLAGEVIEIAPKEEEQPKSKFKDDYDFDTLKEDLLKYVETPSVCREFIDFLKKNDFIDWSL
jgi:hypothetical protein